jgi:serine/threonine-protein kinase
MKSIRPVSFTLCVLLFGAVHMLSILPPFVSACRAAAETVIVSAEGLADPNADAFKRDKAILYDALLDDAQKQAIEKVVGIYVDSRSLVENYSLIEDNVLTQTRGFIKEILQKSDPWLGEDGFMHILIKAEVYTSKAENALREMSRVQRIKLIREAGNPRIAVAITVRDSKRDSFTEPERSPIAENILKEHIAAFGYRVWSEEVARERNLADAEKSLISGQADQAAHQALRRTSDFAIRGEVKFTPINLKLKTSGIEINKFSITSWTVKCLDSATGEELYFNNKIPSRRSWNTEDEALQSIGELIGEEFSREFFEQQLLQRSKIYQLEVQGLPVYDAAILFKKELIGLRPVLNVDLRSFDDLGGALYEVEFSGRELDFSEFLNSGVLTPLNYKFGKRVFSLVSVQNLQIKVLFQGFDRPAEIITLFKEKPPSSLASATPIRLNQIAATRGALKKVEEINPQGVETVMEYRKSGGKTSLEAIKNF